MQSCKNINEKFREKVYSILDVAAECDCKIRSHCLKRIARDETGAISHTMQMLVLCFH